MEYYDIDTNCYCDRCSFRRNNLEKVTNNFFYGSIFLPFWIYNFIIYIKSFRYDNSYKFNELINKEEITLENELNFEVIKSHEFLNKNFNRWVGWSISAILTEFILIGMVVLII